MQQIILPYPINENKLINGSVEYLSFGIKTYKFKVNPDTAIGHKLNLKD